MELKEPDSCLSICKYPGNKPSTAYQRGCRCNSCREFSRGEGRKRYYINKEKDWYKEFTKRTNFIRKLKKYGLTSEEYLEKFKQQNNKCAICGTNKPGAYGFVIDHCHKTGLFRGILCTNCNSGLGMFRESLFIFNKAKEYLEENYYG